MKLIIARENITTKIHNGRLVAFLDVDDVHLMFYGIHALTIWKELGKIIDEVPDFDAAKEMEIFFNHFLDKELTQPVRYEVARDDMFGNVTFTDSIDLEYNFTIHALWVRGGEIIPEDANLREPLWDNNDRDEYLIGRADTEKEMENESQGL